MGSLAERLKEKGFQLIDEHPPAPRHTRLAAPHRELTISASEKRQLFTPLEQQGAKAIQVEVQFQKECGKDLLKGVRKTLVSWVQECLANPEKRQKLHEKGLLKCRVQAQWSKELNNDLHAFIEGFGGRIAASCEKENGEARPAWEKYAARTEQWMVGFSAAAFESFIQAHLQVLGPSDCQLRDFIEDYSRKVDLEVNTIRALLEALETQFGPVTQTLKNRAKQLAAEIVNNLAEERRRGSRKREASDAGGAAKRPRTAVGLRTPEDAAWAADMLAPLGLKPGSNELVAKPPVAVLSPILAGLKTLEPSADQLRSSKLGVIVGSYRHHSSPDIARVAKELVTCWKAACLAKKSSA